MTEPIKKAVKKAPVRKPKVVQPTEEVVQSPEEIVVDTAAPQVVKSQPKILPPKVYDFLRLNALLILPALSTLYVTLAQIWGYPANTKVITTLTALNVAVGALVKKAKSNYNKSDARFDGSIDVSQGESSKLFSLNLNSHPEELEGKQKVTFKVNS